MHAFPVSISKAQQAESHIMFSLGGIIKQPFPDTHIKSSCLMRSTFDTNTVDNAAHSLALVPTDLALPQ